MNNRLLTAIFIMVLLPLFFGCNPNNSKPIKIGYLGTLSGSESSLGQGGYEGALLAIEQVNARGGIGGNKVELVVRDDRQNQTAARIAVEELVNEGVAGIIGPMTSHVATAVCGTTDQDQITILSPTAATHFLSNRDDYFLRIYPTTNEASVKMAHFARYDRDLKRFAVIYDLGNREFSLSWLDNFDRDFSNLGGEVTLKLPYDSNSPETSFHELVVKIRKADVQGILFIGGQTSTALFSQNLAKKGVRLDTFLTEWSYGPVLQQLGGNLVDEMMVFKTYSESSDSQNFNQFVADYEVRFDQKPWFAAAHSYDATRLMLKALETVQSPAELKQAILSNGPFDGAVTSFNLDRFGEVQRPHFISRFRDGGEEILALLD